jgi:hypothetical protein
MFCDSVQYRGLELLYLGALSLDPIASMLQQADPPRHKQSVRSNQPARSRSDTTMFFLLAI